MNESESVVKQSGRISLLKSESASSRRDFALYKIMEELKAL